MSLTAGRASSGSFEPLMTYGPDGAMALVRASVPSTEAMNPRKSLAASMVLARLGDVGRRRHPDRGAVLGGVVAGLAEEADVLDRVRVVLGDRAEREGQHRVLRDLALGEHVQAVVELGCAEVLLVPALLEALLEVLEAGHAPRACRRNATLLAVYCSAKSGTACCTL